MTLRRALSRFACAGGMRGATSPTSPHCARWRSAWSISTSASIASQIGVARMPTQGSWRPVVTTSTALPSTSTLRAGRRRLEVGLNAIDTMTSWPVEMPPSMPPAWLDRKPSGVISSRCSLPLLRDAAKPAPISTPLTALIPIIARGDVGVELAVDRLAPARRHAVGDHVDARADRVAGLAQRVHVGLELGDLRGIGPEERIAFDRVPVERARHDLADLRQVAAHAHAELSRAATSWRSPPRRRASWSRAPTSARRRADRGCRTSASRCSRRGRGGTARRSSS